MARIAYIASDVVLSVQPALGLDSDFSPHLGAFVANKAPGLVGKETPEVRHQLEEELVRNRHILMPGCRSKQYATMSIPCCLPSILSVPGS